MRTKRISVFVLLLIFISCIATVLISACTPSNSGDNQGGNNDTPPHTHSLTLVSAKSADCVTSGNSAYYTCTCGKWFIDSNATTEITDKSSVVIPVTEHKYSTTWSQSETQHWHECIVCGDKKDIVNHTAGVAATETTAQLCTVCDYVIVPPLGHTHSPTLVPEKEAECEVDGNIAYYTCTCGKWFSDSNATTEITDKSTVILKATGHSYSTEWSYNSTQHWYSATCEHTNEKKGLQNHDFQNGVCSICEYSVGLLTFSTLQIGENDTVYGKVSNDTETFSFLKEITANNGANYTVCTDLACTQTITSKTVNLNVGDNIFYILAERGKDLTLFTVTIRRRPIHTVTFQTSGTAVSSQYVEEDSFAVQPDETTKIGYTFDNWTYNGIAVTFPYLITEDITFTAGFTANKYTATLDVNGGNTLEQVEQTVTYDRVYKFTVPERIGYTFTGWFVDNIQLTNDNGESLAEWTVSDNLTVVAHWRVNSYKVTVNSDSNSHGTVSGGGDYDYQTSVTVTATTTKLGYTFVGWYSEDTLLSIDLSYTFDMPAEDLTCIAKWKLWDGLEIFEFNSTFSSLTITGLSDKSIAKIAIPYGVTSISANAFIDCSSLTSVTIPDSVTSIGDRAFYGCNGLESITIPFVGATKAGTSNTYFGYIFGASSYIYYSYYVPTSLKTVIITGGTRIDSDAFRSCSSLTSIEIPNSVTSIGDYAFYFCNSLTNIEIPNGVTSIGSYTFYYCSSLTSIEIPDSVTWIESYAFYGCSRLTSVTLGSNVRHIYDYAFYGCSRLTSIVIPDSVTSIGDRAFSECGGLMSVYITDIAAWLRISFATATSNPLYYAENLYLQEKLLTELIIPNSVTWIRDYTFYYCSSLTSIEIPESVTSIGSNAFRGCSGLTEIKVDSGNSVYHSAGNCLIETQNKTLILGCKNSSIPTDNSVTSIGNYAFYKCSGLTSIEIPNSVTSIDSYAFCYCGGLTNVAIGSGVTSIGSCAFYRCSELISIEIPNSVTSIGGSAFYYCSGLTSVTIGSGVTSIGSNAFEGCSSLTSIEIPNSVKSIDNHAFCECTGLTSITIPSSVTSIGWYVFYDCSKLTIYCEATIKPSGWDKDWNYSNCPVVWNYKNKD